MKIYLDDQRDAPAGWTRCYWTEEVIDFLKKESVEELSLDHDLGGPGGRDGYDVILWLEEQVICHGFEPPPVIIIHSANAGVFDKMAKGIESIAHHAKSRRRSLE